MRGAKISNEGADLAQLMHLALIAMEHGYSIEECVRVMEHILKYNLM